MLGGLSFLQLLPYRVERSPCFGLPRTGLAFPSHAHCSEAVHQDSKSLASMHNLRCKSQGGHSAPCLRNRVRQRSRSIVSPQSHRPLFRSRERLQTFSRGSWSSSCLYAFAEYGSCVGDALRASLPVFVACRRNQVGGLATRDTSYRIWRKMLSPEKDL
jgi:hypothetical protein